MKRGLITWDKSELPPAAFESRLATVNQNLAARDLPALVVYTDVLKSNQGRHFANFMPYWNRALIVLPRDAAPILLCALSPRVYPWIRSVTILDEIRAAGNLTQKLFELCAEKGWKRIGVLDLSRLPNDLATPIRSGEVEAVEVPAADVWPAPDHWEISMHRRAAKLARDVLAAELPKTAGLVDHEVAGILELAFRRAGAEDLVLLFSNGETPPLPPHGDKLGPNSSVTVALEYRGHWAKLSRPFPSPASPPDAFENALKNPSTGHVEKLSGPYPYDSVDPADAGPGAVFALHVETRSNGHRLFYGDTCWNGPTGAQLL